MGEVYNEDRDLILYILWFSLLSLACIVFTQPRRFRIGYFEICPYLHDVNVEGLKVQSGIKCFAVGNEILLYELCNYMIHYFVLYEKAKLF